MNLRLRKKEMNIVIKQGSLTAETKAGVVAVRGKLFGLVEVPSCVWTMEHVQVDGPSRTLVEIILTKKQPEHWPALMKDGLTKQDDMDPTSHYLLGLYKETQEDYQGALHHFQKAAGDQNPDAHCKLGFLYHRGANTHYSIKKDDQKSLYHYQAAADLGSAEGWVQLGNHHHQGWGCPVDVAAAAQCYRTATESTKDKAVIGSAMFSLGLMYGQGGPGLEPDEKAMVDCLEKASALDSAPAHYQLGQLYMKKDGPLPKNMAKARIHFQKAHQLDNNLKIPSKAQGGKRTGKS
eukprot:Ihof_evm2s826 gene=Ihof_evmTU2s826